MTSILKQPATGARPIFIVGAPRSGTSILNWCLAQHPNIFHLEEANWIARLAQQLSLLYKMGIANGDHSDLGALKVSEKKFFLHFGSAVDALFQKEIERIRLSSNPHYPGRSAKLQNPFIHFRCADDPKRRWTDAAPENSFYVFGLARLFPEAKFIHILRHPQEAVGSLINFSKKTGDNYDSEAAHTVWTRMVLACAESERALGTRRMLRVYHEDLVQAPEKLLRTCLDFLEEPFSQACLEPLDHKINSTPGNLNASQNNGRESRPYETAALDLYKSLTAEKRTKTKADLSALRFLAAQFHLQYGQ